MEGRLPKVQRDKSRRCRKRYKTKCNEVRRAIKAEKARWLPNQRKEIQYYHREYKPKEIYKMTDR